LLLANALPLHPPAQRQIRKGTQLRDVQARQSFRLGARPHHDLQPLQRLQPRRRRVVQHAGAIVEHEPLEPGQGRDRGKIGMRHAHEKQEPQICCALQPIE
jgi:hypothetical protein